MDNIKFTVKDLPVWEQDPNGFQVIILDGKEGLIDKNGKIALYPDYDCIYPNYNFDLIKAVKNDKISFYYYNRRNPIDLSLIKPQVYREDTWEKSSERFKEEELIKIYTDNYNRKTFYGFLGFDEYKKFHIALSPIYEYFQEFDINNGLIVIECNNKFGVVEKKSGHIRGILSVQFEKISISPDIDNILRVENESKVAFFNKKGEALIPFKYDVNSSNFKDGLAKVELNGRFGVINKDDKILIPITYRSLGVFSEGLISASKIVKVSKKNFLGLISEKEEILYGFLNSNGETVIDFKYSSVEDFKNGRARVSLYKKAGYIDMNGNEYW